MNKVDSLFLIEFGKNLRMLRKSKKITQHQLAIDAEIEISQISRIERGILNTSISNIHSIARALQVKTSLLFEFDDLT